MNSIVTYINNADKPIALRCPKCGLLFKRFASFSQFEDECEKLQKSEECFVCYNCKKQIRADIDTLIKYHVEELKSSYCLGGSP